MIRRNRKPPLHYKVIKNETGIEVNEDCALVLENCRDIVITGGTIVDADRSGIYFKKNCHDIEVTEMAIVKANGAGIYVDSGCTNIDIHENDVIDCGYWISQRDWKSYKWDIRRFGLLKREGVAIDDARGVCVHDNFLAGNALAAVTLYRNCGEFQTFERGAGANLNSIENNVIVNSHVGLWNAARRHRDLSSWDCIDKGKYVPIRDLPKPQPYQQWWDWSAFIQCLEGNWHNPINTKIYQVPDIATGNRAWGNKYHNVKYPEIGF